MRLIPHAMIVPSVLVSALLWAVGCGKRDTQSDRHAPSDNILRVAMTASPTTFDPAMVQDGTTIDLLQQVYEGLVQWTPDNKVAPALAEKWEVSPDGLTYTFHIRKGVTFQDGRAVTAQDVYYSLHRALEPKLKSPVALTYLGDIAGAADERSGKATELRGVKVIDPQTVAITIRKPKAYWIYTLTYPTGYIVSKAEADRTAGDMSDVPSEKAGTGPFILTQYDKDSRVILKANPGYWGGAPHIAGQERPIVKDANTRHDLYVSGQLDMVDEQKDALQADMKDAVLKDQVKFRPRASTFYIGLNQGPYGLAPFKDVRVRQALAYATDKKQIQQVVLQNKLDIAEDILPAGIPGWDANFHGIPYDPAKARALLAAAGYPGGKGFPPIVISYRESYPDLQDTIALIRQMWQQNLGLTVQDKVTEWTTLLDEEDSNKLPCYHIRWAADYLDQQDYYSVLFRTGGSENHTGYSNPAFDKLCDAADVSQNPQQRNALYRKAARIVADEVPVIPLYYQKDIELVKPYVQHLDDGLMGHLPYKNLVLAK